MSKISNLVNALSKIGHNIDDLQAYIKNEIFYFSLQILIRCF